MWAKTLIPGLALGLRLRMKMKSLTSMVMRDSLFGFDKPKPNFSYPPITIINKQFKIGSFTTKANESSPPGPFDSPLMQSMQLKIKEHLNAESVMVTDTYGDGRHVSIDVVSSEFEGKSAMNRQRMVYSAIWEELQTVVHAVDHMTTRTPSEAASQSQFDDNNN